MSAEAKAAWEVRQGDVRAVLAERRIYENAPLLNGAW